MELHISNLIPYVINMCYNKNIYGFASKVNLNYKILEEIAEQMVFNISEKIHSIHEYCEKIGKNKNIEVVYFVNNHWKVFEIDDAMLMIIYTEKYNNYYVESEEYTENNEDEDILSYSYEKNNSHDTYWNTLLELHNDAKQQIYERHLHLCNQENEYNNIIEFEYISSSDESSSES